MSVCQLLIQCYQMIFKNAKNVWKFYQVDYICERESVSNKTSSFSKNIHQVIGDQRRGCILSSYRVYRDWFDTAHTTDTSMSFK